jgi:dipeptidyl aminopeptidase/acylaminoacyl peptidase
MYICSTPARTTASLVLLAFLTLLAGPPAARAQNAATLTEEALWGLQNLGAAKANPAGTLLVYGNRTTDLSQNKSQTDLYLLDLITRTSTRLTQTPSSEADFQWSHDGQWIAFMYPVDGAMQLHRIKPDGSGRECLTQIQGGIDGFGLSPQGKHWFYLQKVRLEPTLQSRYPQLPKSTGQVFDQLMHRHWDSWHDGTYSHIFMQELLDQKPAGQAWDIMDKEPYHSPLAPMGSSSEIVWSPDGTSLVYPCKKMKGNASAMSTNSDLYAYFLANGQTENLTQANPGYDTDPVFSPDGRYLTWLSMARDGYEADLNRVALMEWSSRKVQYLNQELDRSAYEMCWAPDSRTLYYAVYHQGFSKVYAHPLPVPGSSKTEGRKGGSGKALPPSQATVLSYTECTRDTAHYQGLLAVKASPATAKMQSVPPSEHWLIYLKSTMLRPAELHARLRSSGKETVLTSANDSLYQNLRQAKVESRTFPSTDGQPVQTYLILPPDFDPSRKYPTLIYCQGGPQSMIGQAFSMRWNFHLMAAKGYIVVAPNRRGLPGFGQSWNEQISGDWGGQAMKDLLAVTDAARSLPFVDPTRVAAVGASFGGYSVYWLAGNHEGRFKTFIAHCGVYNLESMFGQTEELFFSNWDMKGKPWDQPKPISYNWFSPHRYVHKWNAPILVIHNEKDYRVPLAQGLEAYTAAQLRGLKTKMLYFPDENHWVLKPQNSVLWQKVFFDWLRETL